MLKACILFSATCLFAIGCYVMFKPDLSDLGFIPVVATNAETASEFRSLFAGSFIAYGYLLLRFTFSFNPISIAQTLAYICLLYTSPSPRDKRQSRMPSSA